MEKYATGRMMWFVSCLERIPSEMESDASVSTRFLCRDQHAVKIKAVVNAFLSLSKAVCALGEPFNPKSSLGSCVSRLATFDCQG